MREFIILVKRLQRFWPAALLNLFLIILTAFTEGFSVLLLIPMLEGLGQDTATVANSNLILTYINDLFQDVPEDRLLSTVAIVFITVTIIRAGVAMMAATCQAWLQARLDRELREEIYSQLLHISYEYLNQRRDSDWHLILNSETGRAAGNVFAIVSIISSLFNMLVYILILFAISWQMTLIASLLLGIVMALLTTLVTLADRIGRWRFRTALAVQYGTVETINAKRLIRIMHQQEAEQKRYFALLRPFARALMYLSIIGEASRQLLELLVIVLLAVLLIVGGVVLEVDQAALIPILSTFILILYRMMPHVLSLNSQRTRVSAEMASVRSVVDVIETGQTHFIQDGTQVFTELKEHVVFKDVTFQYHLRDEAALKHINLEIRRGQTVALVGSSGAGKSTLADLLTRLYDPQEGQILIDGQDLRTIKLGDWLRQVGVVSQDTFVFNNTIAYNIAYGREDCSHADVIQAARYANAHDFIEALPKGYDTIVGDRGVLLSGGQRQRIAIARAILRDPPFLILDEATAALDSENERAIQSALEYLSKDRTSLVIAHRFSTILKADKIVVMEDGQIVEEGQHADLLAKNGRYAHLYRTQFESALSEIIAESL